MTAPAPTWPGTLGQLSRGLDLDAATCTWAMDEIMAGEATPVQLAAFAVLLHPKGETPEELAGLVTSMLAHSPPLLIDRRAVDVVGTGGDRAHTVNISTMAAIVVAATGRAVVKHGNRAASSACGAADVLEELGVAIDLPPAGVAATVSEVGIGFCFAPVFHAGLRHAGPARSQLGIPTVFNFLGPLTNPAQPVASAVGCADVRMAPLMAEVFATRGHSALVFRGDDGLDELTTTTTSSVWIAAGGTVVAARIDPSRFGIAVAEPGALKGGDRSYNAQAVRDLVAGNGSRAVRDAVVLNAGAAIAAFDGLDGLTGASSADGRSLENALAAGIEDAERSIDDGRAAELMAEWARASQRARPQPA
jgi:anthranilate phosphoribosyltransferase